jgi:hypothetical protein
VQFIILFLLAVAWGVLLVPDLLRRRGSSRSIRGVGSYNRQLSALDRSTAARQLPFGGPASRGRGSVVAFPGPMAQRGSPYRGAPKGIKHPPRSSNDAQRRRILVLAGLLSLAILTLAATLAISTAFIVVHLVVDLGLALYLYLLYELRARQDGVVGGAPAFDDLDDDGYESIAVVR